MSKDIKTKVSDHMGKKVVTISKGATFRDAVKIMIKEKTNGLVVVDDKKRVKGILSSWDLIGYVIPNYLESDKHLAAFESANVFSERVEEVASEPITSLMSSNVHTTKPDHSIMEVATLLSEFRIRQLPVVDDEGTLVGYINRTDIKKAIAEVLGYSE